MVKAYDVAVGKVSTLTPEGEFQIINQIQNPTYDGSGVVIAPGNGNPLGTRWMGLSAKGYGIHGTNAAGPLSSRVEAFEGATIRAELERARHNMTETARALGSERSHLYKKCAQLGIQVKQLRSTEG